MPTAQVINGKAFEYAIARAYYRHLTSMGLSAAIHENGDSATCRTYYETQITSQARLGFDTAASKTVETLCVLEPGLTIQRSPIDILEIWFAPDSAGNDGDVRDVIFRRPLVGWEVGISAKNNHDAAKHSRLSGVMDFGTEWLGHPCSENYFGEVCPIFDDLRERMRADRSLLWSELENKHLNYYVPVLSSFRDEMLRLNKLFGDVPQSLIGYLVGRFSFYKVIKRDANNLVEVKAYNTHGGLHKTIDGVRARSKSSRLTLPSRIIEFDFKPGSNTTLVMVLDHGWQIDFRLHSGDGSVRSSLKFDMKLSGNPPVLFTQHLFT